MKLPVEFTDKMRELLKEEYPAFLKSYDDSRRYGLRVNTLKVSAERFEQISPFSLEPIPGIAGGYSYRGGLPAGRHPYYAAGLYYLQEPSAMAPAAAAPVIPGQKVLDLCAAPGGKATALAAKLKGEGLLVANDVSASRGKALLRNLEVFGASNIFVTNAQPAELAERFPSFFDCILVDAPCSGEGMFRKDDAVIRAWTPDKNEKCARVQRRIITDAADMLRPGGTLLYSTCTFDPRENEGVIAHLLCARPDMELIPISEEMLPVCTGSRGFSAQTLSELGYLDAPDDPLRVSCLDRCVRFWPHISGGEGHFLAMLKKTGCETEKKEINERPDKRKGKRGKGAFAKKSDREERQALADFLKQAGITLPREMEANIEIRAGQVYANAIDPRLVAGIRFLRNGLYMGEVRKGRFIPSQAFAMVLSPAACGCSLCLAPDDERTERYLRGETISLDVTAPVPDSSPEKEPEPASGKNRGNSGWQLVCVDEYPLGWGKQNGNILKNRYHPGWRMEAGAAITEE